MKLMLALFMLLLMSVPRSGAASDASLPALEQAFKSKNVAAATQILGGNIDVQSEMHGWPLLVVATNHARPDLVRAILATGADIDATNFRGDTAMIIAAYNNSLELVELLASQGANLDILGQDGATALIWAAKKGHLEVVGSLLRHGVNPNVKIRPHGASQSGSFPGKPGATALIVAAGSGHVDICKRLLDAGANIDATDVSCQSALQYAKFAQRHSLISLLEQRGASKVPECLNANTTKYFNAGIVVFLAVLLIWEMLHARPGRSWRVAGYLFNSVLLAAIGSLSLPAILYEPVIDAAPMMAIMLIALINIAALAASSNQAFVRACLIMNRILTFLWGVILVGEIAGDFASNNPMVALTVIVGLIIFAAIYLNIRALRAQLHAPGKVQDAI